MRIDLMGLMVAVGHFHIMFIGPTTFALILVIMMTSV